LNHLEKIGAGGMRAAFLKYFFQDVSDWETVQYWTETHPSEGVA